jgi:hypothetical protein
VEEPGVKKPIDIAICHKNSGCRYLATNDAGESRCLKFSNKYRLIIDEEIRAFFKADKRMEIPITINCMGDNCK